MLFALINWGLGLIIGALLARRVGQSFEERGLRLHYPIVCAAGDTGLAVWHAGLSGSAPLKATSEAQLTEILGADLASRIDPMLLGETLGSGTEPDRHHQLSHRHPNHPLFPSPPQTRRTCSQPLFQTMRADLRGRQR